MPIFASEVYHPETPLTATLTTVRAAPCILTGLHISSQNLVDTYVQFFDVADEGDVTLGTTHPKLDLLIPAAAASNKASGLSEIPGGGAVAFNDGMVIAATTEPGGDTGPGTGLNVNLFVRRS